MQPNEGGAGRWVRKINHPRATIRLVDEVVEKNMKKSHTRQLIENFFEVCLNHHHFPSSYFQISMRILCHVGRVRARLQGAVKQDELHHAPNAHTIQKILKRMSSPARALLSAAAPSLSPPFLLPSASSDIRQQLASAPSSSEPPSFAAVRDSLPPVQFCNVLRRCHPCLFFQATRKQHLPESLAQTSQKSGAAPPHRSPTLPVIAPP